jgi:hypothetical protein
MTDRNGRQNEGAEKLVRNTRRATRRRTSRDRQILGAPNCARRAGGLPGPGCLLANMMTERAPHAPEIAKVVTAHNDRLRAGFRNALRGQGIAARHRSSRQVIDGMAMVLTIFSNGLWSYPRIAPDAHSLRLATKTMIADLAQE